VGLTGFYLPGDRLTSTGEGRETPRVDCGLDRTARAAEVTQTEADRGLPSRRHPRRVGFRVDARCHRRISARFARIAAPSEKSTRRSPAAYARGATSRERPSAAMWSQCQGTGIFSCRIRRVQYTKRMCACASVSARTARRVRVCQRPSALVMRKYATPRHPRVDQPRSTLLNFNERAIESHRTSLSTQIKAVGRGSKHGQSVVFFTVNLTLDHFNV
jgi:hypothetical protein